MTFGEALQRIERDGASARRASWLNPYGRIYLARAGAPEAYLAYYGAPSLPDAGSGYDWLRFATFEDLTAQDWELYKWP